MKVEKLLNTSGSISVAPGMEDGLCVASETGSKPHIVSKFKKGLLICDEDCRAWKSQRLCSHVLAVAEERKCLDNFLTSYRRSKDHETTQLCLCIINPRMLVRNQVVLNEECHHSIKSQILIPMLTHCQVEIMYLGPPYHPNQIVLSLIHYLLITL